MGWTKLATLAFLLFIIFAVSIFGGHFGYTVNGVPKGGENVEGSLPPGVYKIGDMPFSDNEPTITVTEDTKWFGNAFSYYLDMVQFRVDDTPELFSYVFLFISIMALAVIVSTFIPGLGGG